MKNRKLMLSFLVCFCILINTPTVFCMTPAPVVYVAGDGSGDFNCTGTNDQIEINQALQYVAENSNYTTVHLKGPFTYVVNDTLLIGSNTTLEGDSTAVIKLADHAGWPTEKSLIAQMDSAGNHNITIKGFKIDGNREGNGDVDSGQRYYNLINLSNCQNIEVQDMYLTNNHGDGLKTKSCSDIKFHDNEAYLLGHDVLYAANCLDVEAYDNRITCRTNSGLRVYNTNHVSFYNNNITSGGYGGAGIEIQKHGTSVMDDIEVYNNTIHRTVLAGIWILGSGSYPPSSTNVSVHHNQIYDTGTNSSYSEIGGIVSDGFNVTVENNLIDGAYGAGIAQKNVYSSSTLDGSGYVVTARNNIITNTRPSSDGGNGSAISNFLTETHSFVLQNNCFYNNSGGDYSGVNASSTDIQADPQYADRNNHDYHLKSKAGRWNGSNWVNDSVSSPCIDAGYQYSDYSIEPEPNGDRINIGPDGNTVYASKSDSSAPTPIFPVAKFSTNVSEGYAPLTVQLNDSSENATSVNWDFGDGVNSTEQNPIHTYSAAGNYTINLTASNMNGTDSTFATIRVQSQNASHTGPYAYITNYQDNTVSIIDMATNTVKTRVNVEGYPYGVAVNTAGTKVYVVSQAAGLYDQGTVSVIDTETNTVTATVKVGIRPYGVAINPAGTEVYVANYFDGTVSIIDTVTNNVTGAVKVGQYPQGVAVSPAGTEVYVTNSGDNTVSIIDTDTNTVTGAVNVGNSPYGVAVTPDGTEVYVANCQDDNVSVIDTAIDTVTDTVNVGDGPIGVAVNPAGTKVYVTNGGSSTISEIDTATSTVTDTVNVGGWPNGIVVNPDGTKVYVASHLSHDVSVIDASINAVTATVKDVGPSPFAFGQFIAPLPRLEPGLPVANFSANVSEGFAPLAVQFNDSSENASGWKWEFGDNTNSTERNPVHTYSGAGTYTINLTVTNANGTDSKLAAIRVQLQSASHAGPFAYITNSYSNSVSVIDTTTNNVTATINVGNSPYGIAVNPDGTKVYVANSDSANVSVISTTTNTVTDTVSVGRTPQGAAVNPAGTKVYVANYYDNTVSIIDTGTNTVTDTVNVGNSPRGVAINPDGTKVYVANSGSGTVSVIDTAANTVTETVNIGGSPFGITVNPAGTKAYVTNPYDNTVSIVDTATNTVTGTVNVGSYPQGVAVNPAGTKVYVANYQDNTISVINTATNTVTGTVTVGGWPCGIEVDPAATKAYVVNSGSNTVSMVEIGRNTATTAVNVGNSPISFGQFIAYVPVPEITWSNPADISYGTALNSTQLNASSSVPGVFVYTPSSGTVLGAGVHTLHVDFTPDDVANYTTTSKNVTINVSRSTPSITWSNPADIIYGTALNSTQLNATSPVAGIFAYTPVSGTVFSAGDHTISVDFTPGDAANYTTASKNVTINVLKSTSEVTWSNPEAIDYGTALSETQLNANASVPGSFVYNPASGTVPGAGNQTLQVTFTPADSINYTTATGSVSLTVNKAEPLITWDNPADISYGTALNSTQLNALGSVPGVFVYTPASGTVLGAGVHTLRADFTPGDSVNYTTASKNVTISVSKHTPVITWDNPADIIHGTELNGTQLNASTMVPGTFVYAPPSGTILDVGTHILHADFTPADSANYTNATADVTINVSEKPALPVANFSASTTEGFVPLSVQFTDLSENAIERIWSFGDGNTSSEQNPVNIYSVAGSYNVNLTASNANGTSSKTIIISVSGPYTENYSCIAAWSLPGNGTGSWGYYDPANGPYNIPIGVAIAPSGYMYVADRENNSVVKLDSEGNFITRWGSYGNATGQFYRPAGVAVDSSGNVYVVDWGNCRIQKFDGNGSFITTWGSQGDEDGNFSNGPQSIAMDSSDNVYVAGNGPDRIQKFDSNGKFLSRFGMGDVETWTYRPYGIAVDASGNIYLVDGEGACVHELNSTGGFVRDFGAGGPGHGDGQLGGPSGVAVDSSGNVYVSDNFYTDDTGFAYGSQIQKFNSTGSFITRWGSYGNGIGQFYGTGGIALDTSGNVYVTDYGGNRLEKFARDKPIITPVLPTAVIGADITNGTVPLTVQFSDLSLNETLGRTWEFGDGSLSTSDENPIHTYNAAGTFIVNLTASNANGTDSESATITVSEKSVLPVANFSTNVSEGFAPLTVQFNDLSENATGLNWDFGDGTSSSEQNPAHTYSAGNYTVNLTASNENGTNSTFTAISVLKSTPVIIWGNPADIIYGTALNSTQLNASSSVPGTFVYIPPSGTFLSAGNHILHADFTPADSANYTNATADVTITVSEKSILPVANFSTNVSKGFAPLTVQFNDSSENATSVSWDFNGDGIGDSEDRNPVYEYANSGNHTVNLTASNANGTDSKSATINVSEKPEPVHPVAKFSTNVSEGYAPLTVQFNDSSENTTGWHWDFGDEANSTEQNPMHTYPAKGNYTVNLTASNPNGTNSAFASITVLEKPESTSHWEYSPQEPVCGDTLVINGTSTGEKVDVSVTFEKTVPVSEGKFEYALDNVTIPEGLDNLFTVEARGAKNLNVRAKTIVWTAKSSEASGDTATVSQSRVPPGIYSVKIDGNASEGTSEVNLKITALQGVKIDSNGDFSYSYNTAAVPPGDFEVKIEDITKEITLGPKETENPEPFLPVVSFSISVTTGFAPLSVQFTDLSENADTINWDFNNDGTIDSTERNPVYEYTVPGTYNVNLTVGNENGIASKLATISVLKKPDTPVLPVADFSTNVSEGYAPLSVQFTDCSENAVSWSWDLDNDGRIDSSDKNPVYSYAVPGIYTAKLTVTNSEGQDSKVATIKVLELPDKPVLPVANFTANASEGYAPLSVQFTDCSEHAASWRWDFDNNGQADSTSKDPVYVYSVPGAYIVKLTVTNKNGTDSMSATVMVLERSSNTVLPSADFISNVTEGWAPLTVQFTDCSENATGVIWDFNNDGIADSTSRAPVFVYTDPGIYKVNLTAVNENGKVSKTASITVLEKSSSSGGGSSGGSGGAVTSPEPAKNIDAKELSQAFIKSGSPVKFNFPKSATSVLYITFDSKKTAGKITTIVEMLKNKSMLTPDAPEGEVYNYLNIWVGTGGRGIGNNLENAVICFRVEKSWIQDNGIDPSSITLNRYNDDKWNPLPTSLSGEDDRYLYFTAETPGFSPFAITGKTAAGSEIQLDTSNQVPEQDNESKGANVEQAPDKKESTRIPGFEAVCGITGLLAVFLYRKKQK